jgi:hypothetical protein
VQVAGVDHGHQIGAFSDHRRFQIYHHRTRRVPVIAGLVEKQLWVVAFLVLAVWSTGGDSVGDALSGKIRPFTIDGNGVFLRQLVPVLETHLVSTLAGLDGHGFTGLAKVGKKGYFGCVGWILTLALMVLSQIKS